VRFERLELRCFRGIAEASIPFAPSGVTLVTGPNEAGKSTLVEAIDLLFKVLDDSRAAVVDDVQPKGQDVGPEVVLEIALDDVRMTYAKRWRVRPYTTLHVDWSDGRHENLTGREAHKRAEELLKAHVDLALWRAVRLGQGEALTLPSLATSPSLVRALDVAAGGTGGDDDTLLVKADAELGRYRTASKQQPTGELAAALAAERAARAELAEAEEAYERTQEASAEIERNERELDALERSLIELSERAEDARATLAQRQAVEQQHQLATHAATTTKAELDRATASVRARQELSERLDRLEQGLAQLEAQVAIAKARSERTAKERDAAHGALASATERRQALEVDVRALERARRRLELARREHELTERLRRVEAAEAERDQAEAELAELVIDESDLERLRRAEAAADKARVRHEAASPTVTVEARVPLALRVDGQELRLGAEARWEKVTPRGVVIDLADHARISVRPGATATAEALAAAERALGQALDAAGASSVEEAQQRARQRREVLQRLEAAKTRAEEATRPEPSTEALRQALGHAQAELAVLDHGVTTEAGPRPTTPEALRATLEAREAEVEQARRAESDAHARAKALGEDAQAAVEDLSTCEGARRNQAREVDRTRDQLAAERASLSDEALEELVRTAARRHDEAAEVVTQAAALLEETDPLAAEKAERARAALDETRQEATALRGKLDALRHQLSRELARGNAEKRTEAERAARAARQQRARMEQRAAAAALLVDTLRRHRDQAQQRYRQPLADRLRQWARTVLDEPVGAVELDESLGLKSLTRRGVTLPIGSLSAGTKEQLGLLLRLAAATLAAPTGGVPVILDDALGFSDAGRIAGLRTVLALAASQLQVIVLSAHPERYAGLGATKVELARQRTRAAAATTPPGAASPTRTEDHEPTAPSSASAPANDPAERILACLASSDTPLGRAELCERTGIDERAWTSTIHALVARGLVVQEGHKRGARYRLATDRP